jgi:RNA polymerase sigma-70 factor (ECF subfamily)
MERNASEPALLSLSVAAAQQDGMDSPGLQQAVLDVFATLRYPVYRYLLSCAGNRLDAEDLTQETFLRLVRAVRDGRTPDNLKSWLFQVAHNLMVDWRRECNRTPSRDDIAEVNLASGAQAADEAASARQRLDRFLACLSPRERNCIDLRLEGLRYREIAEVLNIRIPTVQTLLARAAKKLGKAHHD